MGNTGDFVVCMVFSEFMANCTDNSGPKGWVAGRVKYAMVNDTRYIKREALATTECMKPFLCDGANRACLRAFDSRVLLECWGRAPPK